MNAACPVRHFTRSRDDSGRLRRLLPIPGTRSRKVGPDSFHDRVRSWPCAPGGMNPRPEWCGSVRASAQVGRRIGSRPDSNTSDRPGQTTRVSSASSDLAEVRSVGERYPSGELTFQPSVAFRTGDGPVAGSLTHTRFGMILSPAVCKLGGHVRRHPTPRRRRGRRPQAPPPSCSRSSTTSCGSSPPRGWPRRSRARRSRRPPWSTRRTCGWSAASSHRLGRPRPLLRRRGRGHAPHPRRAGPPQGPASSAAADASARSSNSDDLPVTPPGDPLELLAVHEALDQLAAESPRKAELVKLRYFLGLHDRRDGGDPRHRRQDRRGGLDLRPRLAPPPVAPRTREKFARLKKVTGSFPRRSRMG